MSDPAADGPVTISIAAQMDPVWKTGRARECGPADSCNLFHYDPSFGHWDPHSGPDPVPCDQVAVCSVVFACVHEHIDMARACPGCAVDVQQCAGEFTCSRCDEACEVRIKWDDSPEEPVTVVQEVNCG